MFGIHEMVAGIEISVVLDDRNIAAGRPKNTQRVILLEGRPGRLLEDLHFDPADILTHPLIEYGAEKFTPSFCGNRERTDTAVGVWLRFDHGQKSEIMGVDFFEEAVDLGGMLDVMGINDTQDIAVDSMTL